MYLRVNKHRRRLERAFPVDDHAVVIHENHLAGFQFRPVISKRIHQKPIVREGERVVIANALAQAKSGRPPQNGG
jgi:hypothetical protein